jgi:hypothetical protein
MRAEFLLENPKGRCQSEDQGGDGKIILEWVGEIVWDDVDWIYLAQERDHWRVHVKMVLNLWVLTKGWEFRDYLSECQLPK